MYVNMCALSYPWNFLECLQISHILSFNGISHQCYSLYFEMRHDKRPTFVLANGSPILHVYSTLLQYVQRKSTKCVPRAACGDGSRAGPAKARWFIFILEIIIISPLFENPLVARTVLYFHFLATHFRTTQPPTFNQHASPAIVLLLLLLAVGEFCSERVTRIIYSRRSDVHFNGV